MLYFVIFMYCVILHEIAHGYAAKLSGDDTAYVSGRLTLNPIAHIDLIGTIVLPVVLGLLGSPAIFGWAKPVPINMYKLDSKGLFFVSIAGVLTNFLLSLMFLVLYRFIPWSLLLQLSLVNFWLMAFNLIPVPPLDGSKILLSFFSFETRARVMAFDQYGFFLVFILLAMNFFNGYFNWVVRIFSSMAMLILS
jgi:Zn-dependent protease